MRRPSIGIGLSAFKIAPLGLSPASTTGNTGTATMFTATGGVAPYTYSISTNNSLGIIDATTGVHYGGLLGGTDTITVTDALGHTATATIAVTAPAGLIAWHRVESLGSGTLSTWSDSSGGGNTFNGTASPTINATDSQYNNRKSVSFNGTSQGLVTAANITYGKFSHFMVAKMTGTANFFKVHGTAAGGNLEYLYGSTTNTLNVQRSSVTNSGNLTSNWGIGTVPRTLCHYFGGTHLTHGLRINGTDQSISVNANDPGTGTVAAALSLFYNSGTGAGFAAGTTGDHALYNDQLTTTDMGRVEAFLRAKFAHY